MTPIYYNEPAIPNKKFIAAFTNALEKAISTRDTVGNVVTKQLAIEFIGNRITIDTVKVDNDFEMMTLLGFNDGKFAVRLSYDKLARIWLDDFIDDLNENAAKHFTPRSFNVGEEEQ